MENNIIQITKQIEFLTPDNLDTLKLFVELLIKKQKEKRKPQRKNLKTHKPDATLAMSDDSSNPYLKNLPISFAKEPDFMSLAGIWKDKNITIEELRKTAWGDRM